MRLFIYATVNSGRQSIMKHPLCSHFVFTFVKWYPGATYINSYIQTLAILTEEGYVYLFTCYINIFSRPIAKYTQTNGTHALKAYASNIPITFEIEKKSITKEADISDGFHGTRGPF